jgi:hypothetical protein
MASVGVNVEVNFKKLGEALYSQNFSIFSDPAFISKSKSKTQNDFGDIEKMLANTLEMEQKRFEQQKYLEQVRQEQVRQEKVRQEKVRQEQVRQEKVRQEQVRQEQVLQEQVRQEQVRQEQVRKYFQPKRQLGARTNTTSPTIHLQTPSMALKQKMQQQYLQEQQYFQEQQYLQYLQRQYYNANGMTYYSN